MPPFCASFPFSWAFGASMPTHNLVRSWSEIISDSKNEIFIKFCIHVHRAFMLARNLPPLFLTQPFTAFWGSGRWRQSLATPRHFEKSPRPALALHWRWRILQNSHENWCTVHYNSYIIVGTISTQSQNLRIMCYAYLGRRPLPVRGPPPAQGALPSRPPRRPLPVPPCRLPPPPGATIPRRTP